MKLADFVLIEYVNFSFKKIIPLLIIFCFLLVSLSAAELIEIKGLERVEIQKDKILLGDITEIIGGDGELRGKIQAIVLGNAPLPSKTRLIDKNNIIMRIKQYGFDTDQIQLSVPKKISVTRGFIRVLRKEMEDIVRDSILANPSWQVDFTIKKIRVSHDVILPKGKVDYRIFVPKSNKIRGQMLIPVQIKVDGIPRKNLSAAVRMVFYKKVVVTKRPLKRSQLITENDVRIKKIAHNKFPYNLFYTLEDVLGKRTKRKIDADVILRNDLLELPDLVKRGDVVSIIAESDGLSVRTLGKAKNSGHEGERIRLINLDSKRVVYGRILDSRTVMVDF